MFDMWLNAGPKYAWAAPAILGVVMSIYWSVNPRGDPPVSRRRRILGWLGLFVLFGGSALVGTGLLEYLLR